MKKIALNFICKNESHVIERMLNSTRPIIDLIVAVDTGSTDNTTAIIESWGKENRIPTIVFQRAFDNFCNSRNHAIGRLKEVVMEKGWNAESFWGLTIDCDETMSIYPAFRKETLSADIYAVRVFGEAGSFTRQALFHLSKEIYWEGPIHEILTSRDPSIKTSQLESIVIQYESVGGSWKGNLEQKFVTHAKMLQEYVENGNEDFRWVFYTGESFISAAEYCSDKGRKKECLSMAKKWYERALLLEAKTVDERTLLLNNIAKVRIELDDDWPESHELLLRSAEMDLRKAESLVIIITYYMTQQQWHTAYIYSSHAYRNYHQFDPCAHGAAEAEYEIYQWKILFYYSVCCYKTGRKEEAQKARETLKKEIANLPAPISRKDQVFIQLHSPFFQKFRQYTPWARKIVYE